MNQPIHGTPIEARLAADEDGALRRRLKAELRRAVRAIDAELAMPQTPEAHSRLQSLRRVCVAGTDTVDTVWRRARARRQGK